VRTFVMERVLPPAGLAGVAGRIPQVDGKARAKVLRPTVIGGNQESGGTVG